jgi:hypothetical protein
MLTGWDVAAAEPKPVSNAVKIWDKTYVIPMK